MKLAVFLPILVMVGVTNYFVDPAQIYSKKGFETQVARLMSEGHSITATSKFDYDERLLISQYVNSLTAKKQVIAIGSSRVMLITSDFWPNHTFFNAWFPTAQLDDLILAYGFFRQKNLIPDTVLLGVDPWTFDSSQLQWLGGHEQFKEVYDRTISDMGSRSEGLRLNPIAWVPARWQAICSFSYFQDSLKALRERKGSLKDLMRKEYVLTDKKINKYFTLWYDGARFSSLNDEDAPDVVNKHVVLDSNDDPFRLDSSNMKKFEAFVDLMIRDGVKVIFYLPPFHPTTFDIYNAGNQGFSSRYPKGSLDRIEKYCRSVAASRDIKVVGSYDPRKLNIQADQFYDSRHLRTSEDVRFIFREGGI